MRSLEVLSSAYDSIRTSPVRSFLTAFGVTSGVAAVVALVGLVSGIEGYVAGSFESILNSNSFEISLRNPEIDDMEERMKSRQWPAITSEDAEMLAEFTDSTCLVAWEAMSSGTVISGSYTALDVAFRGCTPLSETVSDVTVEEGRFFTDIENDRAARVCVLGSGLAETLEITADDLGQTVKINGRQFTVVGIEEASGSAFGSMMDNTLRIPFNTYENLFSRPGQDVKLVVMPAEHVAMDDAINEAKAVMRNVRGLSGDEEDNFYVVTQEGALSSINDLLETAGLVTVGIAAISLLVGGIGIMNITLVSVAERKREIGTRRALGATRATVVGQFLTEAVLLSLLGGIMGLLGGAAVITLVAGVTPVPAELTPWSVALAFGFSALVGLAFGVFPAWKAAGLSPVEALRYE